MAETEAKQQERQLTDFLSAHSEDVMPELRILRARFPSRRDEELLAKMYLDLKLGGKK